MLSTNSLSLRAGERTLCRELTVSFAPGQLWAVLGPNGSGKTTLLHTLAGLRAPASGAVSLHGEPLMRLPRRAIAQRVGLLLQEEVPSYWGTTLDYVQLGRFAHAPWQTSAPTQRQAALQALRALALESQAARSLTALSGGERQRARIAQLMLQDPDIFCLDEPLLHLDLKHQLLVMQLLQRWAHAQGKLVLAVLHDTLWAGRLCDRALLLYDDGEATHGLTRDLLTKNNLETLYGCDMGAFGAALSP